MKFGIMPKKQIKRITTMQNGNTITIYIIIIAKSFHKCTLTDNKRQGTTSMVIPRLCSFLLTVLRTPSAEPPVNKKVPEPFFVKNRVRVRTVWWTVQDSNL